MKNPNRPQIREELLVARSGTIHVLSPRLNGSVPESRRTLCWLDARGWSNTFPAGRALYCETCLAHAEGHEARNVAPREAAPVAP